MSPSLPGSFRVLVVDDEVALGRQVCAYLEEQGFTTIFADGLEPALAALERDLDLDLVVTDIYLDEREGRAGGHLVCEAATHRKPPLPVILLTGRPTMDAALEGLRAEATDFLTKPVSLPQLGHRARQAIEARKLKLQLLELEEVNRLLSRILPNAIEAKDPTTGGHSDRVVAYTDHLARRVGVPADQRRDLRLAALLHDVGKIGTPEAILCKEGPLTADERKVIEEHPEIGYRILEPLEHLPRVREWVYQHHERWDGRGYPRGLNGDEVALPGRILILAEVYDALATARSYKDPWPREKIAEFFEAQAGRHFDPDLGRIVSEGVARAGGEFFREPLAEGGTEAQGTLF
ncbi:MAG: HD domain-containing phosphohydrolase [Planctomycetota bacterium]